MSFQCFRLSRSAALLIFGVGIGALPAQTHIYTFDDAVAGMQLGFAVAVMMGLNLVPASANAQGLDGCESGSLLRFDGVDDLARSSANFDFPTLTFEFWLSDASGIPSGVLAWGAENASARA